MNKTISMNFKGMIIRESLKDSSVLDDVKIVETEVELVTDDHKTPWLNQWTMYTVEVPADQIDAFAKKMSRALEDEHNWYTDFKNDTTHYIVFRGKVFVVDRSMQEQYEDVKRYGVSLGIPEYQLDFSPKIL